MSGEEFGCPQTRRYQRQPQRRPDIVLLAPRGTGGTDEPYGRYGWTPGSASRLSGTGCTGTRRSRPCLSHLPHGAGNRPDTLRAGQHHRSRRAPPPGFEIPSRGAPGPPLIGRAGRCAVQSGSGGGARGRPEIRHRGSGSVPNPSRHGFLRLPGRRHYQEGGEGQEHPGGGAVQVCAAALLWASVGGRSAGRSRVGAPGTRAQTFSVLCPGQSAWPAGRGRRRVTGTVQLWVCRAAVSGCGHLPRGMAVREPPVPLSGFGTALGAAGPRVRRPRVPRGSGGSAEVRLL